MYVNFWFLGGGFPVYLLSYPMLNDENFTLSLSLFLFLFLFILFNFYFCLPFLPFLFRFSHLRITNPISRLFLLLELSTFEQSLSFFLSSFLFFFQLEKQTCPLPYLLITQLTASSEVFFFFLFFFFLIIFHHFCLLFRSFWSRFPAIIRAWEPQSGQRVRVCRVMYVPPYSYFTLSLG